MPSLAECLERADELAQEVVNTWALSLKAGKAPGLTKQFMDLLDKACLYQTARRFANYHRKHNVVSGQEATEEQATRQAFAEAYKAFHEKHEPFQRPPD